MVEFGLKLSDNKVEDWAHAYLNYEALKNLIAAAQKAEKTLHDLEAQNEVLAAEIKLRLANDEASATEKVDSDVSLYGDENSESQSLISFGSHFYGGLNSSHHESLKDLSNHGSDSSANFQPLKRSGSDASLSSLMALGGNVVKQKVSGYFQRHSYEYKLKKAIKDENNAIQNFRIFLNEDVSEVTIFFLGLKGIKSNFISLQSFLFAYV